MTTRAEPLRVPWDRNLSRHGSPDTEFAVQLRPAAWDPERFGAEQIRGLVRQIFLAGGSQACRQVVVSAVDVHTDVAELCLQVGRTLSEDTEKSACIVEATQVAAELEEASGRMTDAPIWDGTLGALRDCCRQVAHQLWLLPSEAFWGERGEYSSTDRLLRRLDQLRAEFDFSVVQAPAAGLDGTAALLGRLSDGVILVVEAHATHRLAAQKALANLRAAEARLLGTVLSERRFPIPDKLYRRL